jgi:hypothetical protein
MAGLGQGRKQPRELGFFEHLNQRELCLPVPSSLWRDKYDTDIVHKATLPLYSSDIFQASAIGFVLLLSPNGATIVKSIKLEIPPSCPLKQMKGIGPRTWKEQPPSHALEQGIRSYPRMPIG